MHWPMIVSISVLIFSIFILLCYLKTSVEEFLFFGIMTFIFDVLFGFLLLCSLYPVRTSPIRYVEPESIFMDSNYLVCVLNNQSYITGESRFLEKSKSGVVKIGVIDSINSYGLVIESDTRIYIFTKEEWDKESLSILERTDEVNQLPKD